MTRDEKIYFSLLRIGLGTESPGEILPELAKLQWGELYRLAVRQGTGALIWDALRQLHATEYLPLSLRVQWAYNVKQIEDRYRKQEKVLAELSKFYASHSISLMLLKGYGLSFCYPCPEHRECGDIDIWLFGRQREADELLCREWGIRIDEDKHHHTVFLIDGIMVENHYDFLNIHAHASNRDIERLLKKYAEIPGEMIRLGRASIYLPSPRFNALFLLRHAAAHFAAEEIGVRHVVDWAMFIRRHADVIDWPELYAMASRMNMDRFLNCMNAISIDNLGLDAALIPPFERDIKLEKRVLNDILHPEFSEKFPEKGFVQIIRFKFRRWMANRWKHRIVYREGIIGTFFRQVYSHLLKPKSITYN